jgi:hypothetical protein
MRPTLLNFRSPNEKTPDFYTSDITYTGNPLDFKTKQKNKKNYDFGKASRFPGYQYFMNGSGVSCFLGPGTYND